MKKQVIEIEVPEGKKAVWKDGSVVFVDVDSFENIKSVDDAITYLKDKGMCRELLKDLSEVTLGSHAEAILKWEIVVAALTNCEKTHLTTGDRYYPVIQFCRPGCEKNCWGNEIVGRIKSEGQEFVVVGGSVSTGSFAGLGCFDARDGVGSAYAYGGFRSVGSKKIAEHIAKYFGKLLFEVDFGGTNCDWYWI